MIFTKLKLENFKSYENEVIEFSPGISIIVGENGAGKSSIFEAISFALFKKHNGKINDLINKSKLNKNSKMLVSLDFTVDGNDYNVTRSRTQTNSNSELSLVSGNSKRKLASGEGEVNKQIQSILAMEDDLFLNAIYIRQGEIADLINIAPATKKKLFAKLLGIESLEKAWQKSLSLINEYNRDKIKLNEIVENSKKLYNEVKDKKIRLQSNISEIKELKTNIAEYEKVFNENILKKEVLEEIKIKYDSFTIKKDGELKSLDILLNNQKDLNDKIDGIIRYENEIKLLEPQLKKLEVYEGFLESSKVIASLKMEEENIKKNIDSINEYEQYITDNKLIFKEHSRLDSEIKALNQEKIKIEGDLKLLSQFNKDKQRIYDEISDANSRLEEFYKVLNEKLFSKTSKKIEDFGELSRFIVSYSKELEKKEKELDNTISTIKDSISKYNVNINNAKNGIKDINSFNKQCPLCLSEIDDDKKNSLIESYEKDIETNQNLLTKDDKILNNLFNDKKEFKTHINNVLEIKSQIKFNENIKNELIKKTSQLKKIENEIILLEPKSKKIASIIDDIDLKNKRLNETLEVYEEYKRTQGALQVLEKPLVLRDRLNKTIRAFDDEVAKIKEAIEFDNFLKADIEENILMEAIKSLKLDYDRYNTLLGMVKDKKKLLKQKEMLSEDINIKKEYTQQIDKQLNKNSFDEKTYESINRITENTNLEIKKLSNALAELEGKNSEISKSIENLENELADFEKNKKESESLGDFVELLTDIRDLYSKDGIQKELRNRSRPVIERNTNLFFEKFNFQYSDLKLDENYDVSVFGPTGETNIDMVSGGEKIAIAIALRLGISKSLSVSNINTILLDEPTIHLDSFRRTELIEILRKMSILPQMIVVTHDEELETVADNILRVKKQDGISKVKITTEMD
ncbi:MAG: SMC family ATPase [Methanobrevibacter sp.]|jgi:exonuclease SbcC|nr:SMC family ATPase [Candidatus Methanoflexus mossambicus]